MPERATRERVLDRLPNGLAARDILLLHDGRAALTAGDEPVVLVVLPRLIEAARERGLHFVTHADYRSMPKGVPSHCPPKHRFNRSDFVRAPPGVYA